MRRVFLSFEVKPERLNDALEFLRSVRVKKIRFEHVCPVGTGLQSKWNIIAFGKGEIESVNVWMRTLQSNTVGIDRFMAQFELTSQEMNG